MSASVTGGSAARMARCPASHTARASGVIFSGGGASPFLPPPPPFFLSPPALPSLPPFPPPAAPPEKGLGASALFLSASAPALPSLPSLPSWPSPPPSPPPPPSSASRSAASAAAASAPSQGGALAGRLGLAQSRELGRDLARQEAQVLVPPRAHVVARSRALEPKGLARPRRAHGAAWSADRKGARASVRSDILASRDVPKSASRNRARRSNQKETKKG